MALTPTPLTCGWQADARVEKKKRQCLCLHMQPFSVKFRNVTVHVQLTLNMETINVRSISLNLNATILAI